MKSLEMNNSVFFQYYTGEIKNSNAQDTININDFIELHKCNSNEKLFDDIYKYSLEKNEEMRAKLKSKLIHFTPAVIINKKRRYSDIIKFTGLAQLDFDKLKTEQDATDLKYHLFNSYSQIVCCYLSPSRLGVKCLIKIPICSTVEEFRQYYYGICTNFVKYRNFDDSPKNAVLPLFQSYDKNIFYRDISDCKEWTLKGHMVNSFYNQPVKKTNHKINYTLDENNKIRGYIIDRILRVFNNITENGHPQVRSLSLAVGGFVAFGHIPEYEAKEILIDCIRNNDYLQKGVEGYIKTSMQSFELGKKRPLEYEKLQVHRNR